MTHSKKNLPRDLTSKEIEEVDNGRFFAMLKHQSEKRQKKVKD